MSTTHAGLWKPNPKFSICVLVGKVKAVKVANGTVHGDLARAKPKHLPNLLTEFLNWPSDEPDILRFTRRYGPLLEQDKGVDVYRTKPEADRIVGGPEETRPWSFGLEEWRLYQKHLRSEWNRIVEVGLGGSADIGFGKGDRMKIERGGKKIVLEIATLFNFLQVAVLTTPPERMKNCRRPAAEGCDTPYFIAEHLRQEYCSDVCAHWGQKQAKREWWKRRNERIKKATKAKKGGKKR